MDTMEIDVLKGVEWSMLRVDEDGTIYNGTPMKLGAFGTCRQRHGKIVSLFDQGIVEEDIKKVADEDPFFEEVSFQVIVDGSRKKSLDFEGTVMDGLLWLLNRKKEYGL